MSLDGIREALRRQPFLPFFIRLADGRELPVGHPELVVLGARLVTVMRDDNSWSIVEPLLIVSLEYATARRGGNGAGRGTSRPSA